MKLIVCLTGMPGAGKSTIAEGLKSYYTVVNMGDAVRREAGKRNLPPTGENLGRLMLELREKNGPSAVARLVVPEMDRLSSGIVVIDGIRSNDEIEYFKSLGQVKTLSVHASVGKRFGYLTARGRADDPQDKESFDERDARELGVGMHASIALADESISNNNLTIRELVESARSIIEKWAGS